MFLKPAASDPRPTPITALNLGWWAARTYAWDRRSYRSPKKSRLRSLLASIRPDIRRPIFIIGADRSGTTFLGECLAVLPELSYHHEPEAIKGAARYVYDHLWSVGRARRFFALVYGWLLRVHLDGGRRLAEKTPTNSFIVPFLARAFPDAVFVHIIRDGRDATLSLLAKPWLLAASAASGRREPGGYRYGPDARFWVEPERRAEFSATSDLHRCAWSWRRHVEAALIGRELPPERYHELRYEVLVSDPQAAGERLLDFLGITEPKSRAALRAAVGAANPSGVGAWRNAFGTDDVALVEREAGGLLRRLGYTDRAGGTA